MVESTRRFLLYTKMCQDAKKLAAFRHPHKIAPKFDHRLYFGFWARLGDVGNSLKTEIEFWYKLYFSLNSHNYVMFTTKYNHKLNSVVVF